MNAEHLALAVSFITIGAVIMGMGRLQQQVLTNAKAIEKLDAEKASKDSLAAFKEFLEEKFRHVEGLITRDREHSSKHPRAPGGE